MKIIGLINPKTKASAKKASKNPTKKDDKNARA